jgi:hypothetical protein
MEMGVMPPHLVSPFIGRNTAKLEDHLCLFSQYTTIPKPATLAI